jgi:diacylglycerol O-acyltransferase / wax synthase
VDGVSGVDITTVLFDTAREPAPTAPSRPWSAKPLPGPAKLLGEALVERSTMPTEMTRGARALLRRPRKAFTQIKDGLVSVGATTLAGINQPAPPSRFNVEIGPHRRYTYVDADLARFKAIKDSLGGTLNDVVLAAVALALGRNIRAHGEKTDGLVLKAMVPVSVRTKAQRGALGNQVAAMWAPLPVGVQNPAECLSKISVSMADLKSSGQAVGAQVLTNLAGFAPPTILSQAARLQARQPFFNLVVTNVPGPQFPLYLLGRRLEVLFPVVPLAQRQALGIAVMSYDGHLGFGLLGDYDALPDLEGIADDLKWAISSLGRAAGVQTGTVGKRGPRKASARANGTRAAAEGSSAERSSASDPAA